MADDAKHSDTPKVDDQKPVGKGQGGADTSGTGNILASELADEKDDSGKD